MASRFDNDAPTKYIILVVQLETPWHGAEIRGAIGHYDPSGAGVTSARIGYCLNLRGNWGVKKANGFSFKHGNPIGVFALNLNPLPRSGYR